MAGDAIFVITNALLLMFLTDFSGRMFVAFIACVFLVVGRRVTGYALNVVILVKREVFIMIKGRRLPLVGAVTLATFV